MAGNPGLVNPGMMGDLLRGILGGGTGAATPGPKMPQAVPYAQSPLLGDYSKLAYQMAGPGAQTAAGMPQSPSAPPAGVLPPGVLPPSNGGISGNPFGSGGAGAATGGGASPASFNPFGGRIDPAILQALLSQARF